MSQPLQIATAAQTVFEAELPGPKELILPPLNRWRLIKTDGNTLYYQPPDVSGIVYFDCGISYISDCREWIKFAYRREVIAPDPDRGNRYFHGKMVTPNRNIDFEPLDAHDDAIPYIVVDFNDRSGNPHPSVDRKHIWPV